MESHITIDNNSEVGSNLISTMNNDKIEASSQNDGYKYKKYKEKIYFENYEVRDIVVMKKSIRKFGRANKNSI